MSAPSPLARGEQVAPGYEVLQHLRRGRALDVYDVWNEERACRCIAKALRPDRAGDEGPRRRLIEEGRLLRALTHPHIVRGYETVGGRVPVVVMETLVGRTLGVLVQERDLAVEEVAVLGLHLASAIRYLHSHGYLHLDLKPSNVISEAGRAKLIDLSVARPPGPAHPGIGTWSYMSPEQARGGELGAAADVWGIGVVLFEAATGEAAFREHESASGEESSSPEFGEGHFDGDESGLESDEPYLVSEDEWPLAEADYPQLRGPAPRVEGPQAPPSSLGDLVADCLEGDPRLRPSVAGLLERLEPLAGLPDAERRHAQPYPTR